MLILGFKPGHDGAIAVIRDGALVLSLESEKDSFARYSPLNPAVLFRVAEHLDGPPDVVALSGWEMHDYRQLEHLGTLQEVTRTGLRPESPAVPPAVEPRTLGTLGAGYLGAWSTALRETSVFGRPARLFTSSHKRSHVLGGRRHGAVRRLGAAGRARVGGDDGRLLSCRRRLPRDANDPRAGGSGPALRRVAVRAFATLRIRFPVTSSGCPTAGS